MRQDDGVEARQPAARSRRRPCVRRRARRGGRGPDRAPAQARLRDPGGRALSALGRASQCRDRAAPSRMGRREAKPPLRRSARDGQSAGGGIRRPPAAAALRRTETARRCRARARRGSAGAPDGRAVRGARSDRPPRAAAGVPRLEEPPEEGRAPRHPRHARGVPARRPDRGHGSGRIRQAGTKADLVERPADDFVREFVSEAS